jgi:hypothetical protein
MKRDTNVTRKTGQKQPYFTLYCSVELILKPHIEILDNLWYQTILLGYLIVLRANLIVIVNWKSLYCPSASLLSNYVLMIRKNEAWKVVLTGSFPVSLETNLLVRTRGICTLFIKIFLVEDGNFIAVFRSIS